MKIAIVTPHCVYVKMRLECVPRIANFAEFLTFFYNITLFLHSPKSQSFPKIISTIVFLG